MAGSITELFSLWLDSVRVLVECRYEGSGAVGGGEYVVRDASYAQWNRWKTDDPLDSKRFELKLSTMWI